MTESTVTPTNGQRRIAGLISRDWCIGIFVLCLLLSNAAHAGDYAVAYALDLGDLQESGTAAQLQL
jgi:hypothetical protein